MATSIDRLRDMHSGKKKKIIDFREKVIEDMLAADEKPARKTRKSSLKTLNPIVKGLSLREADFFKAIYQEVEKVTDAPDKLALMVAHLAKLYAIQEKLEKKLEEDGQLIITVGKRTLTHPAIRLLQANHSSILSTLKALGLCKDKRNWTKADEDLQNISSFAQFN